MKRLIWIDVGTHFAQEHNSLFGSNLNFYSFVLRRLISGGIFKRGRFVNFNQLKDILYFRRAIRNKSEDFYSIFVEANPKIAHKKKFYPAADLFFNIALTDERYPAVSIAKLYIGHGDELSEGNSIFYEKHQSSNNQHIATLGVSTNNFFEELSQNLTEQFTDFNVLLRLNCEGVEDNVIYSAHKSFGKNLKLVCGSLKDVEELKGLDASAKLHDYMEENNLPFVKFSSGIYSWPDAHKAILDLLENK